MSKIFAPAAPMAPAPPERIFSRQLAQTPELSAAELDAVGGGMAPVRSHWATCVPHGDFNADDIIV